jgi:hypothetical protein
LWQCLANFWVLFLLAAGIGIDCCFVDIFEGRLCCWAAEQRTSDRGRF